jgi:hypothetical protein
MSGRGARRSVDGHDAAFMSVTSATGAEYVYREFYLEVGNVRGGYGFEADLMRLLNEHFKFVGPNRAFEEQWGESTNSEALFAPNPIQVAKLLAKARTMRFRFTPFNASPVIIAFDVRGFDKHIGLVSKTCSWE